MATKPDKRVEYDGEIVHSILTNVDNDEKDIAIVLKNNQLSYYYARGTRDYPRNNEKGIDLNPFGLPICLNSSSVKVPIVEGNYNNTGSTRGTLFTTSDTKQLLAVHMRAAITNSAFPRYTSPNQQYSSCYSISDYWEPSQGWTSGFWPLWKNATFNVTLETILYTTGSDSDQVTYYCVLLHFNYYDKDGIPAYSADDEGYNGYHYYKPKHICVLGSFYHCMRNNPSYSSYSESDGYYGDGYKVTENDDTVRFWYSNQNQSERFIDVYFHYTDKLQLYCCLSTNGTREWWNTIRIDSHITFPYNSNVKALCMKDISHNKTLKYYMQSNPTELSKNKNNSYIAIAHT